MVGIAKIEEMNQVYGRMLLAVQCIAWMHFFGTGCSTLHQGKWKSTVLTSPDVAILRQEYSVRPGTAALARAEVAYAAAMAAREQGHASCVDRFFQAARHAWDEMEYAVNAGDPLRGRVSEIYNSSLNALITEGRKYHRLDTRSGLRIGTADGWLTIPILYHGFARSVEDFDDLAVVGDYSTSQLNHFYRCAGIGVPLVVSRIKDVNTPFQREKQAFAATFVLRSTAHGDLSQDSSVVLEVYNPLRVSHHAVGQAQLPIARDTSAPIARALITQRRSYVQSFLQPGIVQPEGDGLFMLEPYQPGKIPVIFIHGLLSDRLTWANLVNEMIARPEFVERYQIWGFEYSTGEPFLTSATRLRRQFNELRHVYDPEEADGAFNKTVLVGHSMGGLISKVQIAESGSDVWDALSHRDFDQVTMDPDTRSKFAEAVFFNPSPVISRVIFIGTPHRGSALAQRTIGRVGSLLIEEPEEQKARHARLIADNPEAFSTEFSRRFPTSVDLLEPDSKLLQAIERLPIRSQVQIHSIIGYGRWMPGDGDSDGVVPVSSATFGRSVTETKVVEKHSLLTGNPQVVDQVLSILEEHLLVSTDTIQ